MASINQIAADIKSFIKSNNQEQLHRNVKFGNIPSEDLDILFSYFTINLVCRVFGGNFAQQVKAYNARFIEKESGVATDESSFVEYDPPGIGDHQYSERVRQKVIHSLESVIDQNAATVSHNQYVQAAKALLDIVEKTKLDAAEIMVAYEDQLLILASHLVEHFLPLLGAEIKKELRAAEENVIEKLVAVTGSENDDQLNIWKEEIDRVVRSFELKRYELLLAGTMVSNKRVSEAFDFTKDLIDNYQSTSEIDIEEKGTAKLKKHISDRT